MIFSIYRLVCTLFLYDKSAPHSIRQNASTTFWYSNYRLFSENSSSGLSSDETRVADNVVRSEKSEAVKAMLRDFGFSDTQISRVVCRTEILRAAESTLRPKLEFLSSVGVSKADLPVIISRCPTILMVSLKDKIIPCYEHLSSLLSKQDFSRVLKRSPRILTSDMKRVLSLNIDLLRNVGVPESDILFFLRSQPNSLLFVHGKFKQNVNEVIAMGFDPSELIFVRAVSVLGQMSNETWELKMWLYRSFGFSGHEILQAFRSFPFFMSYSENKITSGCKFYINELGLPTAFLARCPVLLGYSLERRIIPRCHVIEVLVRKGLVTRISTSVMHVTEESFLNKYVYCYEGNLPELMDIYEGASSKQSKTNFQLAAILQQSCHKPAVQDC